MENTANTTATNKWLNVPIIATITRLLCKELTLQNEYFRQENKILKSKIKKRICFTDDERLTLVEAAMAMGRSLMKQVVTIVQPKTILAWQRKLEKRKWDYSDRRKNNSGRPKIALDIEQIVCRNHLKEKICHGGSFYLGMSRCFCVLICSRRKFGHLEV